jgi:hypothetical protein
MARWVHPPELERQRERARFDPVAEGARHGLSSELSLAIWERARADATDGMGRLDADQALRRFQDVAARIQTRGGRLAPDVGRLTRVQTEVVGVARDVWAAVAKPPVPGRQALAEHMSTPRIGFEDYRVLGLQDVLQWLRPDHPLTAELIAAAAVADRSIAGRASLWRAPLPSATGPKGHALWQAAERRAATLYRRAVESGQVEDDGPAVEAALQRCGAGQPLPAPVRRTLEAQLGVPLDRVRIHTDRLAADAARAVNAEAFTIGEDIFFAEGAYAPESHEGLRLLAHELAHVVQAWQGRTGNDGRVSKPGDSLEREADAVADRFGRHEPPPRAEAVLAGDAPVQSLHGESAMRAGPPGFTPIVAPRPVHVQARGVQVVLRQPATGETQEPEPAPAPPSSAPGGSQAAGPRADQQAAPGGPVPSTAVPGQAPGAPQAGSSPGAQASDPQGQRGGSQGGGPQDQHGPQAGGPQGQRGPQGGGPQGGRPGGAGPQGGRPRVAGPPAGGARGGPQAGGTRGPTPGVAADPRLAARPARIAQAKTKITDAGETAKSDVRAAATAEKGFAHQAITDQHTRLITAFDDALDRVNAAHTRETDRITSERDTNIQNISDEATRTLRALDELITTKQLDVHDKGERKATTASELGDTQARRVLDASAAKQRDAWVIASRKVAQYASEPRAALIERRINEATRAAVDRMQQGANDLATKLRKDGNDLAAKFRKEANAAAGEIAKLAGRAKEGVETERDEAIKNIRKIATDNQTQLDKSHTDVATKLDEARSEALRPLDSAPAQVDTAIDSGATTACGQVDDATQKAAGKIDDGEAQAAPRLALLSGIALTQALSEADAAIAAATTEHRTKLEGFVGDARTAMHATASEGPDQVRGGVDRATQPLAQIVTSFDGGATKLGDDTQARAARIAVQTTGGWATRITETGTKIDEEITKVDTSWQRQLDDARADMTSKADRAIADFASTVGSLPGNLDTIADRIKSESLLSRIWNGFVGFLEGILDRLGDLLKGLVVILLIVLAIVVILVIVGVIVFLVGGPGALLAYIAGVIAVVAAIAAFLAAVGPALLVIAAIVLIGVSLWENLPIILDPSRTDEERWRAVGRLFTDIVLAIFAEKIFGYIGKLLGRVGRLLGLVGSDEARLARLLALVGGDEARLAKLVDAFGGDAARLDAVLGRIGNDAGLLERILAEVGNNGARAERLLGMVGNDGAKLLELIRTFDNNAALLERVLSAFGGDVARAEAALAECGGSGALMDDLLAVLGEDGTKLERLLGMIGEDANSGTRLKELLRLTGANAAEVERLMGLPQFAGNAARLEKALAACDDIPQLEKLITSLGGDGQMLEDYLRLSGATQGSGVAGELDGLVNFAKGRAAAAGDLRNLLDIAGGDAGKFRQFSEWAQRFKSPRTGAPNTPPGNLNSGTPAFSGANTEHFMTRHTFDYFDVSDIKDANTFFNSPGEIIPDLEAALDEVRAAFAGKPFPGPNGQLGVQVNGKWFQVGWRNGPPGPRYVGQFFPAPTNPGMVNIPRNIMEAIAKIIGP